MCKNLRNYPFSDLLCYEAVLNEQSQELIINWQHRKKEFSISLTFFKIIDLLWTKILLMPLHVISYPSKHTRITISIQLSYEILPCIFAKINFLYHFLELVFPLTFYNFYQIRNWWILITKTVLAIFRWGWSWININHIFIWKFTFCESIISFLLVF